MGGDRRFAGLEDSRHRCIPRIAVEEMLSRQQSALPISPQTGKFFKVLVLEDDPAQLDLYRQKFAEWHLPIILFTANDGFEGLIFIGRHTPDLIITDLRVQGMDGFRMIRQLREQLPDIPIYSKPIPFAALRALIEMAYSAIRAKILCDL